MSVPQGLSTSNSQRPSDWRGKILDERPQSLTAVPVGSMPVRLPRAQFGLADSRFVAGPICLVEFGSCSAPAIVRMSGEQG